MLGRAAGWEAAEETRDGCSSHSRTHGESDQKVGAFFLSWFQKKWFHQEKARFQFIGRGEINVFGKDNRLRNAMRRSKMAQCLGKTCYRRTGLDCME